MKKIVSYILLFILMVSIPSFSYAQNIKKENVPNGTYIIGTYSFDKNKTANYNGTLTTQMIMLASKSINTTTYNNMVIYFKNSRGKWINAITGKEITSVPSSFEITCANLNCQSSLPATSEGYVTYTNGNVGNGSYIIGNFLFDKNKTANYNGTLTTQMIMLAAKSITSNNLNDMIIYYKNSRGKWVNAINNQAVSSVPQTFNISYIDLTKTVTKPDDKITVTKKTINYTGDTYTAFVTTLSGLTPTITYYSNSTCTTQATPKEAGLYYIKATTAGNSSYNAASLGCTLAIEIKKIDAVCPIIADYTGTYDKKAHSISVDDISDGGTIEYKTDSAWQTTNPTRTDAGQTTVYVHVVGDNNHNTKDCGSKKIAINKANDKITVKKKSYVYDGSVKKPTITVTSGLTPTITYYSDSTCSTKTIKNTDSTSNGGAPYAVGTYYVKGSTAGNTNYNAATLACTEAVTIKSEKTNDEITVVKTTVPYTGSAIPASVETLSDLTPSLVYYSNSTCTTKTTTSNASSAGGAPIKVGTYYVTGSTSGNDDYNAATLSCTEALTITKRTVSITAPKLNSTTLTYNGSAQTISKTSGSCTAGGTMYYYTKNYTTTTAPTFDTTNWSTTYPTIKQTNAGTYYLWYYCKVDDLTNNTGTNINKAINVNKAIGKKATTLSLSATSGTLTYGSPVDVTITTDGDGNITCSSSDETVATCTVDNTNKKITVTPKANTADSKKATITVSQAEGTNYKAATNVTYTATVNRKTLSCPTSPADKTYNGNNQASGITCPTGSKAGGDQTKKNAGSYAQTCTANAGYKFSSTCSVAWKINQKATTMSLSATSGTLTYGTSVDVTITTDGDGNITCSSSDEAVATCTADNTNKKITVTPKANTADSKKATITVSQAAGTNYKATSKTYTATVNRKTLSCPTSPADKTYNGTDQASGITCPTGSKVGGDQTKKNAGSYAQTCTANAGYKFASTCSVAWKINKRTVTVTAPKANTATLTYNGSDQTISGTAGSCTTGGTMYYYTKNYTTTTAPTFDTTNWSTTYPTAKGKNARKYYMWYYCKVDDTANNEGININKAISVTKTIGKKATTLSLKNTSGTLTYGSPIDVVITTDGDGNITCSSSDETVATCTVDNTNKKLTITPKANTADSKKATITVSQAEGTNYKAATDVTYTATVNRKIITCPTSPAAKTYTGSSQASGITCPTGSTAGGNKSATNAGDYVQTCTANAGYKFASTCSVSWTINQRTVTVTAPTMNSNYLIYNGLNQTISGAAGSCSAGGTMYYYNVSYVNSTAPSFNTTNWSTTYPTILGQNAGTYNLWYYCKVDDTANNTGTNINTAKKVSATINKKASSIDANIDNITMNPLGSLLILSDMIEGDGDGELSCSSSNESYASCSVRDNSINITNTYYGSGSKNVNITLTKAATANYSAVSKTYTITVKGYVDVTSVSIDKSFVSLIKDETTTLTATIAPTNATDKAVTWSSSNTAVATVDQNGKVKANAVGISTITATSANGKKATATISVRHTKQDMSSLFNSDGLIYNSGSGRYTYAPGVLIDSSSDVYIYTCANPDAGNTRDHIFLLPKANVAPNGSYVLSPFNPGGNAWDSYHNCDPSIVEGNFTYGGTNYKYAMAYTGINNTGIETYQNKNKIGIAVSNSLTGNWRKVESPIIDHNSTGYWGVGQPSLLYANNKLILIYTNDIGSTDPILKYGMQVKIINPNGFGIEGYNYLKMNDGDWIHNADFAYKDNRLYVAYEGPEHDPNNANYNGDIISSSIIIKSAYMPNLTDINAYSKIVWDSENVVDSSTTGNKRNTNAGLFRGAHGELYDRKIIFTATNTNGNAKDSSGNVIGHFYYNIYQIYF